MQKEWTELIPALGQSSEPHTAFSTLVEDFQAMAFGCAYSILRDPHLAEDAVQSAFLEAWEHLSQLKNPAAFSGWLRQIVVHQCYRQLRKPALPTLANNALEDRADDRPDPAAETSAKELRDRISAAFDQLPADERVAAILYHLTERSYREIANYTRVPQTTVEYRLRNARRRLRKLLSRETALRRPMMSTINEEMINAIESGNPERLEQLIGLGADVRAVQSLHPHAKPPYAWYPPLFVAIQYGQPLCSEILLRHGAFTRVHSWDALGDAETLGYGDIAELIRLRQAKEAELLSVIGQGRREEALQIVDKDPTLVHANEGWHGFELTPLMHAIEQGDVALVELILQRGANAFAETGATSVNAMTVAVYHQNEEIIQMLAARCVESGAMTNLLYAARKGDIERVKAWLEQGVDINGKDECHRHVLPQAFMSDNYELIDFLYQQGADPNQSHGWEDYMWLEGHVRQGDEKAVRWMFEHGYDPDRKEHDHTWLMNAARESERKDMEQLLLSYRSVEESNR